MAYVQISDASYMNDIINNMAINVSLSHFEFDEDFSAEEESVKDYVLANSFTQEAKFIDLSIYN